MRSLPGRSSPSEHFHSAFHIKDRIKKTARHLVAAGDVETGQALGRRADVDPEALMPVVFDEDDYRCLLARPVERGEERMSITRQGARVAVSRVLHLPMEDGGIAVEQLDEAETMLGSEADARAQVEANLAAAEADGFCRLEARGVGPGAA